MSDIALKYFYATTVHGSMRAASQSMNVAVSSISRQIALLEDAVGMALLETGRRSIKLTRAGEITFEYCRARMAEQEAFVAKLDALRELKTGTVELAVGEGLSIAAFDPLFDSFRHWHPSIEIVVSEVSNDELVRLLQDDEVHIGVGVGVGVLQDPKVRVRARAPQRWVAVCRSDHPLAAANSVALPDLAKLDLCLPMKGSHLRAALRTLEARHGVRLNSVVTTNSVDAMRSAALCGRGVAILPEVAAKADVDAGALVAVEVAGEHDGLSAGVMTRIGRRLPGAPVVALELLEQQLRRWPSAIIRG